MSDNFEIALIVLYFLVIILGCSQINSCRDESMNYDRLESRIETLEVNDYARGSQNGTQE